MAHPASSTPSQDTALLQETNCGPSLCSLAVRFTKGQAVNTLRTQFMHSTQQRGGFITFETQPMPVGTSVSGTLHRQKCPGDPPDQVHFEGELFCRFRVSRRLRFRSASPTEAVLSVEGDKTLVDPIQELFESKHPTPTGEPPAGVQILTTAHGVPQLDSTVEEVQFTGWREFDSKEFALEVWAEDAGENVLQQTSKIRIDLKECWDPPRRSKHAKSQSPNDLADYRVRFVPDAPSSNSLRSQLRERLSFKRLDSSAAGSEESSGVPVNVEVSWWIDLNRDPTQSIGQVGGSSGVGTVTESPEMSGPS